MVTGAAGTGAPDARSSRLQVGFFPDWQPLEARIGFVVMAAFFEGRWLFCRHRRRSTLEFPGGKREPGEGLLQAARRELFEETGAQSADLAPLCAYSVQEIGAPENSATYGLFLTAQIRRLGPLPANSEIGGTLLLPHPPRDPSCWTYPGIQPRLLAFLETWQGNGEQAALQAPASVQIQG